MANNIDRDIVAFEVGHAHHRDASVALLSN